MALPAASPDGRPPAFFHEIPRTDINQLETVAKVIRTEPTIRDKYSGYVYATKEAGAGFVKIGWSADDEAKRPLALEKCGLEFTQVFYTKKFQWAYKCERIIHRLLVKHCHYLLDCRCGVKAHREWYKMDFLQAVSSISVIMDWMLTEPYEKIAEEPFKAQLKLEWKERLTTFGLSQKKFKPQRWEQFFENPIQSQIDISPWRLKYRLVPAFVHSSPADAGGDAASDNGHATRIDTLRSKHNKKSASFSGPVPTESPPRSRASDPHKPTSKKPDLDRTQSAPEAGHSVDSEAYTASEDDDSAEELLSSPTQLKAKRREQAALATLGGKATRPGPSPLSPRRAKKSSNGGQEIEQKVGNVAFHNDTENDEDGGPISQAMVFFSAPTSPTSPRFVPERQAEDRNLHPAVTTQLIDFDTDAMTEIMGALVINDEHDRSQESGKLSPHSGEEIVSRRKTTGVPVVASQPSKPKPRTRSSSNLKGQCSKDETCSEPGERPTTLSPSPMPHSRRSSLRSSKNLSP